LRKSGFNRREHKVRKEDFSMCSMCSMWLKMNLTTGTESREKDWI
jgi:hypothetical protein